MSRLIVLERKRIIPLILLVILMGGLSFYDVYRGDIDEGVPVRDDNGKKLEKIIGEKKFAEALGEAKIELVTADKGFRKSVKYFEIARNLDEWVEIAEKNDLSMPDYPYNENTEIGIFAFNSEIKDIQVNYDRSKDNKDNDVEAIDPLELEVLVEEKDNFYHILAVSKDVLARQGGEQVWKFVDDEGKVLYESSTDIE